MPILKNIIRKIGGAAKKGRLTYDPSKPDMIEKATDVIMNFEIAFNRYETPEFDQLAMVLGSSERIAGWRPGGAWHRHLAAKPMVFEVGRTHSQVLNMRSPAFEKHIEECLLLARENKKLTELPVIAE